MAWNGPIDGDYSNCDFSRGPWTGGIMVLNHDEVVYVLTQLPAIIDGYTPQQGDPVEPGDMYIHNTYNSDYSNNWEKAINGDTFSVIKSYDPEVNTQGIDEQGIIPEEGRPVEEPVTPEEPTPEEGA